MPPVPKKPAYDKPLPPPPLSPAFETPIGDININEEGRLEEEMGMSVRFGSAEEEDADTLRGSRLVATSASATTGLRADVSAGSWLAEEGGFGVEEDEHNDIRGELRNANGWLCWRTFPFDSACFRFFFVFFLVLCSGWAALTMAPSGAGSTCINIEGSGK